MIQMFKDMSITMCSVWILGTMRKDENFRWLRTVYFEFLTVHSMIAKWLHNVYDEVQ